MKLKNYVEKVGLIVGIISSLWLMRIYIIVSWGYRYIVIEDNLIILYSEILFLLFGAIIMGGMLYSKL